MRRTPDQRGGLNPYHLGVVTGPEDANNVTAPYAQGPSGWMPAGQAPHQVAPGPVPYGQTPPGPVPYGQAPYGQTPPGRAPRRPAITYIVLAIGLLGLLGSLAGVSIELLPRHFSAAQQQQIMTWEEGKRWREMPAGEIFARQIAYVPPEVLNDAGSSLKLTARRVGIAPQTSCPAGTDASTGTVLGRNGCEAVLRATYTDDTDTYVVTVGVGAFPSAARAAAARRALDASSLRLGAGRAPGVQAVSFAGSPAAEFTNSRRQISDSIAVGPYLVMYAIGYADDRPVLPISDDSYQQAEMTSLGTGVARDIATMLGAPPPVPHCPGAPGC